MLWQLVLWLSCTLSTSSEYHQIMYDRRRIGVFATAHGVGQQTEKAERCNRCEWLWM